MTNNQKYIIFIILILSIILFSKKSERLKDLPPSIGDPLELIIVKNTADFKADFFLRLKNYLTIDIGPSPQPESVLSLVEIEKESFKGIFKRHQNLLIVSKANKFNITIKRNLFANNQTVILIDCPSYNELKKQRDRIINLVQKITIIEARRLGVKFKKYQNSSITKEIKHTHNISLIIPQDFFLAHTDSAITWTRRETEKISQGIFVTNLIESKSENSPQQIISIVDTIIKKHILGPGQKSYMKSEKEALVKVDTISISGLSGLKIQSLWKMQNDFMGGIFNIYYFDSKKIKSPLIIYTYLYAPGEEKNVSLLQLDAIVKTLKWL